MVDTKSRDYSVVSVRVLGAVLAPIPALVLTNIKFALYAICATEGYIVIATN